MRRARSPGYTGSALYPYTNIDTYVNAQLKTTSTTGDSSNTGVIVGVVVAIVVVMAGVTLVVLRRRPKALEG